jgi:hypothetical protein
MPALTPLGFDRAASLVETSARNLPLWLEIY